MRFITKTSAMLTAAIFTLNAQAATPTDTVTLSLDQCITIALDQSPTIKVADMEIQRMDLSRKETLGQFLPSVNFGGTYSRTLAKQVAYMNMNFGSLGSLMGGGSSNEEEGEEATPEPPKSSKPSGIKMGLDNSYSVGFSAGMPLINVQLWKSLKLSDAQILETIEKARQSRLNLVNSVQNAYYALLLTIDSREVLKESLENAKFSKNVYEKKFAVGTASEYDVLRTSVQVKNAETELERAETAIRQARLQLALLLSMDPAHIITPATTLSDYQANMYDNAMSVDRSIDNNADLRMLDVQTDMLQSALKVQKAAYYPSLSLGFNYNWTSSSNGTPFKDLRWNPYSMLNLSLDFPIFTGFQRYHRVKQAEVQINEMKWNRQNLVNSINTQVDLSIDNINLNVKQIATTAENVKQAEKAHEIMEKSFEIGAATYLDLRDSELALTNTRLSYYQAIYNYLIAECNLQLLLGNTNLDQYSITR